MDPLIEEELAYLMGLDISFYMRADLTVRLLTVENVFEVMDALPEPFYTEFVLFAREVYLPTGERTVVAGAPIPEPSLEAIRGWLQVYDEAFPLNHDEPN